MQFTALILPTACLLTLLAWTPEATFSVIAKDKWLNRGDGRPETSMYAMAVTSRAAAHVADCLYVDPKRRFILTAQMQVSQIGEQLTDMVDGAVHAGSPTNGETIIQAMKEVLQSQQAANVELAESHQYGLLTFDNHHYQFTGTKCCPDPEFPNATQGHQVVGAGDTPAHFLVAVQANIVARNVLSEMLHGFREPPLGPKFEEDAAEEDVELRANLLGLRVLSALRAGQAAGGDVRHWGTDSMKTTYSTSALAIVRPDADPMWVFYPPAILDEHGKNHSDPHLMVDHGITLEQLRQGFFRQSRQNFEKHSLYALAIAPRWPWERSSPRLRAGWAFFSRVVHAPLGAIVAGALLIFLCGGCFTKIYSAISGTRVEKSTGKASSQFVTYGTTAGSPA